MDMQVRLTEFSHGGGCGCKIAPGVLEQILSKAAPGLVPKQLLVGIETADDAASTRSTTPGHRRPTDFFMRSSTTRSTSAPSRRPTRSPTCTRWAATRSFRARPRGCP